jgi:hypothetical protein
MIAHLFGSKMRYVEIRVELEASFVIIDYVKCHVIVICFGEISYKRS